jgi:hypothetical protein
MDATHKTYLERMANEGRFIGLEVGYQCFADLDGKAAREFLEKNGFEVIESGDTGNNGFARTACGIVLSTNGWIYRPAK